MLYSDCFESILLLPVNARALLYKLVFMRLHYNLTCDMADLPNTCTYILVSKLNMSYDSLV